MANRFLYIDDNLNTVSEGIIRALNVTGNVSVTPHQALSWDDLIVYLTSNNDQYDGLLIDWKLGTTFGHDAEVLAQHIRVLVNNGLLARDIPVLLCSANSMFREEFGRDATPHDLFLTIYTKDEIARQAEKVALEMNSLADSFKIVQRAGEKNATDLLDTPEYLIIDPRLEEAVLILIENRIPHNLIRYFLKEVIEKPGLLIDEYILAARLGIDLKTSEDWPKFRDEHLSEFLYNGILREGWKCWWAAGFENWWKFNIPGASPKGRTAKQRVKLLIEKTNLTGLTAAEKQKHCSGTEFWTTCVITKLPLDPIDGFRLTSQTSNLPWQDERFVSPFGLLDRFEELHKNSYRLSPFEKDRWQKLRKNHTL